MDFHLNSEQKLIAGTARRIGEEFGLDYWRDLDKRKGFPHEIWRAICDAGMSGVAIPQAQGGVGLGMFEMALIVEQLAASGAGSTVGQLFMINPVFGGISISKFGSVLMQDELLPKLIRGELNFCMAMTESSAGSNSLEINTFARSEGSGWILNGQKIWISGVDQADKMLVVARTQKFEEVSKRTDGISLFMIDVVRDGLEFSPIEKLGTNTLASFNVYFDDVHVTPEELVGDLNGGWYQLLEVLNTERIVTTAGLVGAAELAIKLAVEFANERRVFGEVPIGAYQGIQYPLAQAHAELECARLMNYKAARLCDLGEPYGSEANRAKLIAAQAAADATERSMQTMGGMGYSKEFHVERLWRDARLFRFAPISEEMILNFIAVYDLEMPRSY